MDLSSFKTPENVDERREWYKSHSLVYYTPKEELLHATTHFLGVLAAVVMLVFMLLRATTPASYATAVLSCFLLGLEFLISAIYHGTNDLKKKLVWRQLDYPAVNLNVLACGSALCLLYDNLYGYIAFSLGFVIAFLMLFGCLFAFGKFRKISVGATFIVGSLLFAAYFVSAYTGTGLNNRSFVGYLYLSGLLLSLLGALLFRIHRRYVHAVFHVLVLFGPILCMVANYYQLR